MTKQTQQGFLQGLEWLTTDADGQPWLTAMDVPGRGAATLAALTLVGSGTVAVAAIASVTLADLLASAAGTVSITGTAGNTLGALTSAATGRVAITGTLAQTLEALTGTGGAAQEDIERALPAPPPSNPRRPRRVKSAAIRPKRLELILGEAAITLGELTLLGAGTVATRAQARITLGALRIRSRGRVRVAARSASTLEGLVAVSAGRVDWSDAIADDDEFLMHLG